MPEGISPFFRAVLGAIAPYRPGRKVVSPEGHSYKLSSNESPYGPLPSVSEAIAAAAQEVNRYPDNGAQELIGAIGARFGVPEAHIAVGAGSVGVAEQVLQAAAEPGTEVAYAWRSFEAYPLLVDVSGATSVQVPLREETHDLPALAKALGERTRLVFVCNPNNPTGTAVRRAELEAFLDAVPEHVLVVLDEAYREYVRDDDIPDGMSLYPRYSNVAVLRTFSKAYGLAGLRVGYLVGPEHIAEGVRKTMTPFAVNHVAQAAAVASLGAEAELMERVEFTVTERIRVREALTEQGYTVPEAQANFVWLRLGERTGAFADHCAAAGVAVRPFAGEGVRISIGDGADNDALLAAARAFGPR